MNPNKTSKYLLVYCLKTLYFLIIILLIGFPNVLIAQADISSQRDLGFDFSFIEFWEGGTINGKLVREIKEWRRRAGNSVSLGNHYRFRGGDGKLGHASLQTGFDNTEFYITYTTGARFHWIYQYEEHDSTTYIFAYPEGRDVIEQHQGSLRKKTFYYKNETGEIIEKKVLSKNMASGEEYQLYQRIVYNYNNDDHLFGEMHYNYENGKISSKRKVIYEYDPATELIVKTTSYNEYNETIDVIMYDYNVSGQLQSEKTYSGVNPEFLKAKKEYGYENGKLVQTIETHYITGQALKPVWKQYKVYRNGRLIYMKTMDGKQMLWESNYQYVTD